MATLLFMIHFFERNETSGSGAEVGEVGHGGTYE